MKLDTTSPKPRRLLIEWAIDGFTVPVKVKRTIDEIAREIRTLQLRTKPVKPYKFNPHLPCQHSSGYWINEDAGNFRCYECGCQFHLSELPRNKRNIERANQ